MAATGRETAYVIHHREQWGDATEMTRRTSDHSLEQANADLAMLKALAEGRYMSSGNGSGPVEQAYFPSLSSRPDAKDGYKNRDEAAELVKDEPALLELMLNPPPQEPGTTVTLDMDAALALGSMFRQVVERVEAQTEGSDQKERWERSRSKNHISSILQRDEAWPENPVAKRGLLERSLRSLGVTNETLPVSIKVPEALAEALGLRPTE